MYVLCTLYYVCSRQCGGASKADIADNLLVPKRKMFRQHDDGDLVQIACQSTTFFFSWIAR
jgi:hypothetical protein